MKVITQQFESMVDCYSVGTGRTWLYVLENQNPLCTGIAFNIIKGVLGLGLEFLGPTLIKTIKDTHTGKIISSFYCVAWYW